MNTQMIKQNVNINNKFKLHYISGDSDRSNTKVNFKFLDLTLSG